MNVCVRWSLCHVRDHSCDCLPTFSYTYAFIVSSTTTTSTVAAAVVATATAYVRSFTSFHRAFIIHRLYLQALAYQYILIAFLHMGIFLFGLFFGYSLFEYSFLCVFFSMSMPHLHITNLHVNKSMQCVCVLICQFIYLFLFWAYSWYSQWMYIKQQRYLATTRAKVKTDRNECDALRVCQEKKSQRVRSCSNNRIHSTLRCDENSKHKGEHCVYK